MQLQELQVNTPPTEDDGTFRGSQDSTQSSYSTPPPRRAFGRHLISGRARVVKTARTRRRPRKDGADREQSPDLPGPLSEMTNHMTHIPVRDMEAFVHRPIAERLQEARSKGKIKRPMNSFMLYRAAYSDRIKALFQQNNHQDVSRASGKSWRQESPAIKQKYEELANIEKNNHNRAHPEYKFAPKKECDTTKKKRRRDTVDEEPSDLDDTDTGFAPGSIPPAYMRQSADSDFDSGFESRDSTPFDTPEHGLTYGAGIPIGGYYSSSFNTSNPERPVHGMMPSQEPGHYIETSVRPGYMGSRVEDVFRRSVPEMQYTSSSTLAGLPGGAHYDLLQPATTAAGQVEGQLDPRLLVYENDPSAGAHTYPSSHPAWQEAPTSHSYLPATASLPLNQTQYPMPAMQSIAERDSMESGHEPGIDAPGGEFDRWFDPHTPGY